MVWAIFHRRIECRQGKLCFTIQPWNRPQSVKRAIRDYAVAIGAATPIEIRTRDERNQLGAGKRRNQGD